MAQTNAALERFPEFLMFTLFDFDEDAALTTTFQNILDIDARSIGDSVIVFHNPTGNANLEYRIYATAKKSDTQPPDADDSWINILRDPANLDDFDPANYNHLFNRSIPANKKNYESFTNQWSYVRVSARLASGSGTCKIWHRGAAGGI